MMSENNKTVKPEQYNMGYVWLVCLVAAMGGLLFGYDWVVIGGAKPFFEKYFQLNSVALSGWANSCALLGCLLGSLFAGVLSDMFGRKKLLLFSALLFATLFASDRLGIEFFVVCCLAHRRRRGDWNGFKPVADVYR